jgi:gliding motility-associated-like protein
MNIHQPRYTIIQGVIIWFLLAIILISSIIFKKSITKDMHHLIKACIVIFFIINSITCYSQYLSNPSFEGQPEHSVLPSGWGICDENSTPDTQPGIANTNLAPADGNTYISLVVRGFIHSYPGTKEDCITTLLKPLLKDKCYKLQIDLAYTKDLYDSTEEFGLVSYGRPVKFEIYGGSNSCELTELLGQVDSVYNENWENFEFNITPTLADINYLILKADFARLPIYPGNILVDNIRLYKITPDDYTKLDTTINYGETITIHASNASQYHWSPDIGLSCDDCQNPTANVPYNMTYTATLIGQTNCYDYKEFFNIKVVPNIPNIITPNGDGKNDVFKILGLEQGTKLIIMDRWGKVFYETDNYDNSWDGKYKGTLLQPDTYWYLLKFPSDKTAVTGYIYLKL